MTKRALTPGGVLLAKDVADFMKRNIDEMKKSKGDAASNETMGTEDMANAIAYAVERALGQMFTPGPGWASAPGPVTGSAKIIGGTYQF